MLIELRHFNLLIIHPFHIQLAIVKEKKTIRKSDCFSFNAKYMKKMSDLSYFNFRLPLQMEKLSFEFLIDPAYITQKSGNEHQ